MWTTAAKATNGLLRQQGLIRLSQQAVATRCFAGKAATKKKDSEDKKNSASYFDRKEAQKAARTQRYQANLQIIEQRKHRRDDAPKDTLKSEFRSWFEQRRAQDQQWDRQARQQGKEWKIQVAVVLERLPQILPDKADWETEYDDLYSHLAQFGKEYPKEFSGTLSSGGPVSITDEELLGT
jgi:thiamine pyrophosphate-dependent acetolactate synthase large subunit-like protein